MRAKKKQLQRQTEAQKTTEQNAEGWRQTSWPSKLLVIISLVCFIGFCFTGILWVSNIQFYSPGEYRDPYNTLTEAYWDKIYTTDEMIQLLMHELDWPVNLEDRQWWFDCRERLGLE